MIAGAGCGSSFFRALQKKQIPFAAGILFENDVDYRIAKELSDNIISVPAFEPMTEEHFKKAAALMESCGSFIDAGAPVGSLNRFNGKLLAFAREKGIKQFEL